MSGIDATLSAEQPQKLLQAIQGNQKLGECGSHFRSQDLGYFDPNNNFEQFMESSDKKQYITMYIPSLFELK